MEFRVLGPFEVVGPQGPVALGGRKQRAVLAHLVLRANRPVAAELLIDELWGDEPPETARNTLQTYVYRLRKLLGDGRIEGRDGAYVLTAEPEEVDASRFEAIVKEAKELGGSDPQAAAQRLGEALSLWRGPPLADLADEPSFRAEIARLEELRLSATERRIAAEVAAGGHSTVVSELEELTARHPLRERMWANLMLALMRLGRQAEALATYQRAREVLAEELGTEPSDELQRLHERILRGDPELGRLEAPRPAARSSRVDMPPGSGFAGYRIVSTLGRGGMSVVYLAEHDFLQRKVALKVLAPQLAEDERFRERFVRESRLAASLDHPNVIPIYEAGASGDDLFIAMRYVEGTDLRTLLREGGALEPERTLAILRQVADALDAAHEQGLVHRDVKPGNVLLAKPRGPEAAEHVYLSDFGLTKRSASDSGVTGTGQFVGTLDYAAPEQFTGEAADARTDVYSLGCVLFECLTGRPPFRGENDAALMYAHLQQPPPAASEVRPDLPREVDRVLARAMAKDKTERYPTAGALVDEIARALGLEGRPEVIAEGRGARRRVVAVLTLVAALAAGVGVASLLRPEAQSPPPGAASPTSPPVVEPTTPPAFRTVDRTLSADESRLLAFVPGSIAADCLPLDRDEPVQGELAALVCRTEDVEVLYELFPTRDRMDAAFQIGANTTGAPDGECATDRLALTPYTIGGQPAGRVLCYTVAAGGFAIDRPARSHIEWTDENSLIYAHAVRNDLGDLTLYEWWLSSSGPIPPGADPDESAKDRPGGASPRRLSDGTYLTAPPRGCAGFRGESCAMRIEGSTYEIVFPADLSESVEVGLLLLQKPDLVVFSPRLGYCLRASTFGAVPSPDPAVFAFSVQGDRVSFEHRDGGDCAGPMKLSRVPWTRAPAARIALERLGDIRAIDAGGFLREELSLDDETRPDAWPDWSPDGSRFVYSGADREGFDLYVRNADGSGLEQITSAPGDEITPAWSPDGSRIAFVAHPDDGSGSRLMVVNADGTGAKELLATGETSAIMPVWSPDASRIAFTIREPSGSTLHVIGADGEDLERVREDAVAQAWTPDGRIVFTTSDRTMGSMLPDGSRGRSIIEGLPEPIVFPVLTLSPDGGWIVVSNGWSVIGDTEQVVYLLRADGTESFWIGYGSEPDWRPT